VTGAVGLFERLSHYRLTKKAYVGVFIFTFLFVSFFLAWRDEHSRAERAERKEAHPHFSLEAAEFAQTTLENPKTKDFVSTFNVVQLTLRSPRLHAATNITVHFFVIDSDMSHSIDVQRIEKVNDVGPNEPLGLFSKTLHPPRDGEPWFVFVGIAYRDAQAPEAGEFHQSWYFKTSKFTNGMFTNLLYDPGPEEKIRIVEYLKKQGGVAIP